MFKGRVKPKHNIYRSACADKWKRGNFTVMTDTGHIWIFDDSGDRKITLR